MFDEIYDVHEQIKEYRPQIQHKVKHLIIEENEEINKNYTKTIQAWRNSMWFYSYVPNVDDHTTMNIKDFAGIPGVYTDNSFENLHIGKFSSIGERNKFVLNRNHNFKKVSSHLLSFKYKNSKFYENKNFLYKGDINIGNDVWTGMDVTFLSGITVGDGAVIGACSVVTKDVPPYAIVGGNPAKILKYRFTEKQIEKLLKIKWWEWPIWKVYDNIDIIDSENIDEFIKKFYEE